MIFYGDISMTGGRIRGLSTAVAGDEPVRKSDAGAMGTKRVQTVVGATGPVTCDWSLYDEIRINAVGDIVFTFDGATDGQGCVLTIYGGFNVTLPAEVRYNSVISLYVPTSGATALDKLGFQYHETDDKYDMVSMIKDIA
jgi:hypothetical protein